MNQQNDTFIDYVESLLDCENFSDAFAIFENEVTKMGFEGALYTYIPQLMLDANASLTPVYEVSEHYAPAYLAHYAEARFDQFDPLIAAVKNNESDPINWSGPVCQRYMQASPKSIEVLEVARDYGIGNGITLPLMSGPAGIAGASFISSDLQHFDLLLTEQLDKLRRYSRMFHTLIAANSRFQCRFSRPLIDNLSATELQLLRGLALGQSMAQVATDINRGGKYLEQVMLSLRRKLSPTPDTPSTAITRNQLFYYAGLIKLLDHPDSTVSRPLR